MKPNSDSNMFDALDSFREQPVNLPTEYPVDGNVVSDVTREDFSPLGTVATAHYNETSPYSGNIKPHPYFPRGIEIKADSRKGLLSDLGVALFSRSKRRQ